MQNPFSIRSNSFVPAIIPPVEYQGESYWFLFRGDQIFVKRDSSSFQIPFAKECRELGVLPVRVEYLGVLNGSLCFSGELDSEAEIPAGFELQGIRGLYGVVDDLFFGLTGLAFQIVDWDRNNQFCGRCGTPMDPSETERCKICPRCRLMVYPRLSPAVIMRVQKGDQILMARSPRFLTKIYSVLAGFVEPGESLEEAVAREVFEEVEIKIREIK
jgi:NAD+ diphosphatase